MWRAPPRSTSRRNRQVGSQTVRDALYAAATKGVVTSANTANNHLLYMAGFSAASPPSNTSPPAISGVRRGRRDAHRIAGRLVRHRADLALEPVAAL